VLPSDSAPLDSAPLDSAPLDSAPLDTIGNYDLLEKVGKGSMGVVYRARHWESKAIVAIKVMHSDVARNPVLLKRFEQEFRISNRLSHAHIVKAIEFCGAAPQPYLVMEYIEGESLIDRLERQGKLPEEEAVRVIVQIAEGLDLAHQQGLIHRDVKPDNIMIDRDGQAKLLDLGLAKVADSRADLTRAGQGLGTPDFMAPEQFRHARNASVRCDIYSLGATLYMMVTGRYPFDEDDPLKTMLRKLKNELPAPRQLEPALSERTDWAIRRAMSGDAQQRPESCREFIEDLLGTSERVPTPEANGATHGLWYVAYTDGDGKVQTIKGSVDAMRQSLRAGRLGDPQAARGSQAATGPFLPLSSITEFRDLVIDPAPGPALSEESSARLTRLGDTAHGLPGPTEEEIKLPAKPLLPVTRRNERWELVKMFVFLIFALGIAMVIARFFFPGR
jgi:serine/threonine protein kinase